MANVANLRINAVVNDQATPALKRINGALNGLNSGMSGTSGGALGAARALTSVGGGANMAAIGIGVAVAATAALVAGTIAVVKASVAAASEVEGYRNTLLRLTGDAAKADATFKKLQEFADWSPFDDASVMQSAQRLLGAGVAAEDLTRVMTGLSDISGDSAETFGRASLAFSQMLLKGKVSQEELNQFAEAGIPAQKMLADAMGVSTSALGEMASKGQLVSKKVLPLLIDQIEKQFGGSTERASQSVKGLSSTMDAKLTRSLATLGKALEPLTKQYLRGMIDLLADLDAGIGAITASQEFQDFLAAAGEAFKAVLEVIRPVMTILFDMGRAVLPYITIAVKAFTLVMRLLGAGLQFVARLLKPVWDYIRALGNALKSGIDWVMAWGARIGEWPKLFGEARDWVVEFIGWIKKLAENPAVTLKILWDVAALTLPKFADQTIKILWNVAEIVLPGLKGMEILVKLALSGYDEVRNKLDTLMGRDVAIKVTADTGDAVASMDDIKERTTSLREPAEPWTVTVTGIVTDALDKLAGLRTRIIEIVTPNPPWQFEVSAILDGALSDVKVLLSALALISTDIVIGVTLNAFGLEAAINMIKAAVNSIPALVTTVHRTIEGDAAVANELHPSADALSIPPQVLNLGSASTSEALIGKSMQVAMMVLAGAGAMVVQAVAGGRRGNLPFACFTGDTRVWTSNGLMRIAEIVPGDIVEVYDPETGAVVMSTVADTLVHVDHPVWHLRIYGDVISTTAEHPFLTPDGWRRADELRTGSAVITATGREIVEESHDAGRVATVHNIHVDHPAHTYLVGTARWVVHNFKTVGARGAIVTQPTMAMIGEAGPEALVPLDTMPGASPIGSFGGGGIDTVIINVSGFADGATAGRAAADAFRRQLGLQRRLPFGTA
jgi:tape measure domain-containing protein